jgi:hypothetical protein
VGDRERFFEDDSLSFPQEGFNLDFQSDRFEIRKVKSIIKYYMAIIKQ